MNKLIFLFLSLLSFALHALIGDHKAFVDVKAQTVVIDEPAAFGNYLTDSLFNTKNLYFFST
jgi:hypothetical protein